MSAVAVEFDQSFVYNGHRLVYDIYGSPDAPLVVYMHGLLLDAELNRGIAQALAEQGYKVVLLDLLGHGRSDKPTHASEYRIDSYADQVIAIARPPWRREGRARRHLARRQRQPVRGDPLPGADSGSGARDASPGTGRSGIGGGVRADDCRGPLRAPGVERHLGPGAPAPPDEVRAAQQRDERGLALPRRDGGRAPWRAGRAGGSDPRAAPGDRGTDARARAPQTTSSTRSTTRSAW